MTIVFAYLILWPLINLSHVAGHLLVARLFGIAVDRVSLGLGPSVFSRVRGKTTYRIALLPIAVLVRLRPRWKEGDESVWPPTDPLDLRTRSIGVRAIVFASAPLPLLFLSFFAAFLATGFERMVPDDRPVVGDVVAGMPAEEAGVMAGDLLVSIDGKKPEAWIDVPRLVSAVGDDIIRLEVVRGHESLTIHVEPVRLTHDDRTVIGIRQGAVAIEPPGFYDRVKESTAMIREYLSLRMLPSFSTQVRVVSGPIGIVRTAAVQRGFSQSSFVIATYFPLTCLIWCLVFPYLDGRRFLFLGIETAARRPLHPKYEQRFNLIWLAVLVVFNAVLLIVRFGPRFVQF